MNGDGFARCARGHMHWGRYGAAGLMLHCDGHVLLQQRAWWCNGGGSWGTFGGGRHGHEDAVTAALRETAEESSLDVSLVAAHGLAVEDHDGWSYTAVIGTTTHRPEVWPASSESKDAGWFRIEEVDGLRLFRPFALSWPRLRTMLTKVVLVVDAANVMGSRPDGWWRDRLGAAARLRDSLAGLGPVPLAPFDEALPEIVLVVEGQARALEGVPGVRVVAAPGSGDDAIVGQIGDDAVYYVVTADRELRARCEARGATALGPRWLLDRL
ncbi:NUDIX domain-containing protein [Actinocorallia longicatena]|uniref:NUDIX domain-containing protein n=1 Tax=Actinocorallia longicatena TaxID=111803 RepID=A0ABP6Q2E5_9ACTN